MGSPRRRKLVLLFLLPSTNRPSMEWALPPVFNNTRTAIMAGRVRCKIARSPIATVPQRGTRSTQRMRDKLMSRMACALCRVRRGSDEGPIVRLDALPAMLCQVIRARSTRPPQRVRMGALMGGSSSSRPSQMRGRICRMSRRIHVLARSIARARTSMRTRLPKKKGGGISTKKQS